MTTDELSVLTDYYTNLNGPHLPSLVDRPELGDIIEDFIREGILERIEPENEYSILKISEKGSAWMLDVLHTPKPHKKVIWVGKNGEIIRQPPGGKVDQFFYVPPPTTEDKKGDKQ